MGLLAKEPENNFDFEIIPEGTFHAICYAVYDLGTHYSEYYGKSSRKIQIIWEVPELRIDIEKNNVQQNLPRAISKRYTLSLHKNAALRKDLESWRGKAFTAEELTGFELRNLLGVNCLLQIIHRKQEDKTFANVNSISKLLNNMEKKTPENQTDFFSLDDGVNIPENCPDWIKETITKSNEWDVLNHNNYQDDPPPPLVDDDIPF